MSKQRSVFFEDWLACLRAHYVHVIQAGDEVTQPTLRQVLLHSGLSEDELRALEATAWDQPAPGGVDDDMAFEPQAEWDAAPVDELAVAEREPFEAQPGDLPDDILEVSQDFAPEIPLEPDQFPPDEQPPASDEDDWPPPGVGQQLSLF